MLKNQKGFTIIELLVVIVIIGILVALALPNLFAAQARGRDSDRKNEVKNLQQRLETHFNDNGVYPQALTNLNPAPTTDESQGPRGASDGYTYTPEPAGCTTACDGYTLYAVLENTSDPDGTTVGTQHRYTLNSVN